MAQGRRVTPPEPLVDLRVQLSPSVDRGDALGAGDDVDRTLALITLLLPQASGVMNLLAALRPAGDWRPAAMAFSCALNLALGGGAGARRGPWVFALQSGAVLGYTSRRRTCMPELIDHCGPLVKNRAGAGPDHALWLAAPQPQARTAGVGRPRAPGRTATARPLPITHSAAQPVPLRSHLLLSSMTPMKA